MPRTARASAGGICYHVINRGNERTSVFRTPEDYNAFVGLPGKAVERTNVRVLAYRLMPNHFHLVLWPRQDGSLSRFRPWLLTTDVRWHHRHYHGGGHWVPRSPPTNDGGLRESIAQQREPRHTVGQCGPAAPDSQETGPGDLAVPQGKTAQKRFRIGEIKEFG